MLTVPKIRLIVVDDHEALRFGLKVLIKRHANLEVVGSASNGLEAVELAYRLRPDVAIMDVTMPLCGGLVATSRLRKELPDTRVLAFSCRRTADAVLAALRAGALGYVCKGSPYSVLFDGISVVALGKRFIDPALTDATLRNLVQNEPMEPPSSLTPREDLVLHRVAWGFANKEIAAELGLSTKTVEGYRARACVKLTLIDRPAIVKYAQIAGWLDDQAS